MFFKLKTHCLRLILLLNLVLIFTLGSLNVCSPAIALLRQHHEPPNILRYHAQDSLKDRDGNTWQVLLFPESISERIAEDTIYDSQTSQTRYYLRLVGFPGIKSFDHPQSLEIITSQGNILTAADAYRQSAPAPNVGQYDLTPIMSKLPAKGSLKLSVILKGSTLKGKSELSLKIPQSIVTEWQLLTQELEL